MEFLSHRDEHLYVFNRVTPDTKRTEKLESKLKDKLEKFDENLRPALKKAGYLTRDARIKERKKYGLLKARKDQPYVKR